jgi:phospholipase C
LFDLAVYGPNGYVAHQRGEMDALQPVVTASLLAAPVAVQVAIENRGSRTLKFSVVEAYTNFANTAFEVSAGTTANLAVPLDASFGWYDLIATAHKLPGYLRRFAGHVENGQPSIGDPGPSSHARKVNEAV